MKTMLLHQFLSISFLFVVFQLSFTLTFAVREITTKQLYDNIQQGLYDIIIDVRTQAEWNSGHITNATLVIDLAQGGNRHVPILGCQQSACKIAVYCRSGARARAAAAFLESKGFPAPIDNGQGMNGWIAANYPVATTTTSFPAKCATVPFYTCPTRGGGGGGGSNFVPCFSGHTKVSIQHKGLVAMKDVRIGDHVLVQGSSSSSSSSSSMKETYEPVYDFGHYDPHITATFLKLFPWGLEISEDHMIFVEGGHAIPASAVQVGDRIMLPSSYDDGAERVESVTMIQKNIVRQGVYAPFTTSGTIVVNGVVASTFIAFQNQEYLTIGGISTGVTFQWMARTFQFMQLWFGRNKTTPILTEQSPQQKEGMSPWVSLPLRFAQWWFQQHPILMFIVAIPVMVILSCLSIVEWISSHYYHGLFAISFAVLLLSLIVPNHYSKAKFIKTKKTV